MIPWTPFEGFVGGSYQLNAKSIDAQRTINLFPEVIQSGSGKGGAQTYLKSVPGLEQLFSMSEIYQRPIRLIHPRQSGGFFVVAESDLWLCTFDGTTWTKTLVGGATNVFSTSSGPVRAATSIVGEDEVVVFVDGVNNYLYYYDTPTSTTFWGNFAAFGYPGVGYATHVKYIDGYFVFNKAGANQFYVSDYASFTVDPLSFASAEGDIDNIEAIEVLNRNLILLNSRSTEIWYNSGNADFPFERTSGGFFEQGILAKYSVGKDDKRIAWLARSNIGQGEVYALSGMVPEKISDHALEQKIATYANPENATGYMYNQEGHTFYVLTFDEATWAFDFTTGKWCERAGFENGELTRERIDCYCFIEEYNLHVCGDKSNSRVYKFSNSAHSINTEVLVRERIMPHVSARGNLITCYALKIEMEVGVGLNGTVQGSDPKAMLSWSDDDGHTWCDEITESIGKIGEKKVRVIFRQLGTYRSRIYKLRFSDPVPITLTSADLQIKVRAA